MNKEVLRLRRRLQELAAWRDIDILPLEGLFCAPDLPEPVSIQAGTDWPSLAFPAQMTFTASVPQQWAGQTVMVRLAIGGEGLLLVKDSAVGGLDSFHREHLLLEQAQGDEQLSLEVEAVPRKAFGEPVRQPRIEEASLIVPDLDVRALWLDLATALDAATQMGAPRGACTRTSEIADLLVQAVSQAFAELSLPKSPSENYLARIMLAPEQAQQLGGLWEEWHFTAPPVPLPDDLRPQLRQVSELFLARLNSIRQRYPPLGELLLSGHAHLDVAWLWPLAETRRKARRTFANVLTLMRRYPTFTFNQSSAQLYAFIEEDDPDLFARIQEQVKEGRWELVGGTWVEPDGNLLSGESWVRQLLYGQRYFESRFGQQAHVAWLPDSFGFAANLPQLFLSAGLDGFITTKLNWNETNAFPYDLYRWEGLDGSQIAAHSFRNPNGGYNGRLEAKDLAETWQNFQGKRFHTCSFLTFGHGDGGGGPTADMLERYQRFQDFPGLPRLKMGRMDQFFQEIRPESLPTWVGEQYLELHRGTYTTQAQTKALNRHLEHILPEAEMAATLAYLKGANYPAEELEDCWKTLLRNQFHDILPGSGIHTVAAQAQRELSAALDQAETLLFTALTKLSQEARGQEKAISRVVAWNLSLDDRPLRVTFPRLTEGAFRLVTPAGSEVAYQESDGNILAASRLGVPGLGFLTLSLVPGQPEEIKQRVQATPWSLENRYLRVEIAEDGTLKSVYDKESGRESLAGRGNQIWAYPDVPREWDAWDVDESYLQEGQEILSKGRPELIEAGPARAGVQVIRHLGNSKIEQRYWLWADSRRLEIDTRVQWEERRTLLRALFPLTVRTHEAWFETAFGAVPRPTHRNTSWDRARFEVPALRFADMSEARFGVSLLNDAKYGHSARGNVLGLTLLRGPVYPDPLADWGKHLFTYALYPHPGDWRSGTVVEAHDLNAPLRTVLVSENGGKGLPQQRLLQCDHPALRLAALKCAEEWNGAVLRLYEAHGGRGEAFLNIEELGIEQVLRINLLEVPQDALVLEKGQLHFQYTPYQVLSFMLARG